MAVDHDHLVWKALVALDEAVHRSHHAPLSGDYALRFTLAYLHATGSGDRRAYDEFWRAISRTTRDAHQAGMANYMRSRDARTATYTIARGHGIELTFEIQQRLGAEHGVKLVPPSTVTGSKKGPS